MGKLPHFSSDSQTGPFQSPAPKSKPPSWWGWRSELILTLGPGGEGVKGCPPGWGPGQGRDRPMPLFSAVHRLRLRRGARLRVEGGQGWGGDKGKERKPHFTVSLPPAVCAARGASKMHVQPPHLACLNLPLTPRDPQDQVHSPWTALQGYYLIPPATAPNSTSLLSLECPSPPHRQWPPNWAISYSCISAPLVTTASRKPSQLQ